MQQTKASPNDRVASSGGQRSGITVGFRGNANTHSTLTGLNIVDEDDIACSEFMLRPSTIRDIWKNSKVKNAMFNYMTDYFKPRSSYEPERVEYNALNILTEYQVYNLEFAKNELHLTDFQSALVLDLFWRLLEFDPDADSSVRGEVIVNSQQRLEQPSHEDSI